MIDGCSGPAETRQKEKSMSKLVADITTSLDGFITGPNDAPGRGLGERGEVLHNWVMGGPWRYDDEARRFAPLDVDRAVLQQTMGSVGAGIIGRRMFDVTGGWGGNPPGGRDAKYFVLTHSAPPEWVTLESPFTFVTDGIESALEQAKAAAGDKDVGIGGGANVIQQYLAAGLVDELRLHLAPVLLGAGKRLFDHLGTQPIELEQTGIIQSPYATHLSFTVRR
jgi:dihydrofolate reductase